MLLVHPHTDSREMYAEYLRFAGWTVLEAADAWRAVEFVAPADIVVTGLRLDGDVDGVEFIARIRQGPAKAIVVLTADVFPRDRQRAEAAGSDGFLTMTCLPDALDREIRRVLRRRQVRPAAPSGARGPGSPPDMEFTRRAISALPD